jgi:hypothetical protein
VAANEVIANKTAPPTSDSTDAITARISGGVSLIGDFKTDV